MCISESTQRFRNILQVESNTDVATSGSEGSICCWFHSGFTLVSFSMSDPLFSHMGRFGRGEVYSRSCPGLVFPVPGLSRSYPGPRCCPGLAPDPSRSCPGLGPTKYWSVCYLCQQKNKRGGAAQRPSHRPPPPCRTANKELKTELEVVSRTHRRPNERVRDTNSNS